MFSSPLFVLFIIALIVSALGFYKYVYFISLGYGFSIAAMGAALLFLFRDRLTVATATASALFIIYGMRLGGYLLLRELKSASYNRTMKQEISDGKGMKLFVKVCMWLSVAVLYLLQISPVVFRMKNGAADDAFSIAGFIVMVLGIALESASDFQKSAMKAKNPNRFCDKGLFAIVRCPNYLGEVLFWTGVLLCGSSALRGAGQIIAGIVGWACIVYIMFGGARRLELRQNRRYGSDPEYQAYVRRVPILLPFVPLYSVAKYKWLVG